LKRPITKRPHAPKRVTGKCTLAIGIGADGSLPREFRLFAAGWNDTENGRFLFDADAAASVMAAHSKWGVDLMIDLEHQALNSGTPPEPNARDARGWFRLELRPDGSLWAVGVSWTPDGEQRLRDKRQRYVSPAFSVDEATSRVTAIINVALVAIPATHDTPALVAASALGAGMLSAEILKGALDALMAGDEAACMDILKGIVVEAAAGEPAAEETPADAPVEMAADPAKPEEDKPAEMAAALSVVASLSGKPSLVASVADIRTWHTSHVELATERKALAAREAVLESAERRKLCVELVTLAGRAPATVWADDKATAPKPYFAEMKIERLREMHADAIAANGKRPAGVKPPVAASGAPASTAGSKDFVTPLGVVTLSAKQIADCEAAGAKPEVFATNLAHQIKARGSKE
jgi:phage I-like protein